MKNLLSITVAALSTMSMVLTPMAPAFGADQVLPAGTRLYLTLDENVSSARGGDDVGTIVRCRVWRDVEAHGVVFFKSGQPATCRVDKVSRRNMGGFEGNVSIAGVETKAADDQTVMLAGGYHKEGNGHKAVVLTVGILLLWPALFIPGGNAELPPGTVFDVTTVNDLKFASNTPAASAPRMVDLRNLGNDLNAEFMLDDFIDQPKHDVFRIKVSKDGSLPEKLTVDTVNGKPIEPITLDLKKVETKDGTSTGVAEVSAKTLAKFFAKGVNRFDVAYKDGDQRKAAEVVMDVQM